MVESTVNAANAGKDGNPDIATLANGTTVVAYQSEFGATGGVFEVRFQLIDAQGSPIGSPVGLGQQSSVTGGGAVVSGLSDGSFVVSWIASGNVLAQRFDANGVSLSPIITVDDNVNIKALAIEPLSGGGFVISALHGVASGGGSAAVLYNFATNAATTFTRDIESSSQFGGSGNGIKTLELPTGYFSVWAAANDEIKGEFHEDGSGNETIFFDETFGANGGIDGTVAAAELTDGSVVVAWAQYGNIRMLMPEVSDEGSFLPGEIANANRIDETTQPDILALSNGNFVIVWAAQDPATGDYNIKGQTFDSDGVPVGGGFLVNDVTDGPQVKPGVSEISNGGIRVVWQTNPSGNLDVAFKDLTQAEITAGTYTIVEDSPTVADVEITGDLVQGEVLGSGPPPTDANGIAEVTYSWYRNAMPLGQSLSGEIIAGANGATYTPVQADVGETLGVLVSVTDDLGNVSTFRDIADDVIANQNDPVQGEVSIDGAEDGVTVGETLRANPSLSDPDGLGVLSYTWSRDGIALAGTNSADYAVTGADLGAQLSVTVSYVDDFGATERVTSDMAGPVGSAGPTEDADLIIGGTGNDSLTSLGGADTIYAYEGDDTIDGGAGADRMIGGPGSDTYHVDDTNDFVGESRNWAGHDVVYASIDFRMGRAHIEDLYLTGPALLGAGNGLANEIRGTVGDNILDGGKNNDTLIGGAGNDTYLVRAPGDTVIEAAGRGVADTVKAFRAYKLTDNVERLYLQTLRNDAGEGIAGVNGIGNDLDNTIVGNPFDNVIVGREGRDTLKGQAGADTFVFDRAYGPANVDRIIDFNVNVPDEGDILKMKGSVFGGQSAGVLDSQLFTAGTQANDSNDRFIFDAASGNLWFDADGAGGASQILIATFEQNAVVSFDDILIY
ncbi:calcium-binding protein [Pseudooceanicola atlanticus]|uniref:calcium-binding protein n=1 Tax=Pseudooceanicola atlanticus TaxID=1461694 RepID=UPI002357FF88|nr:hypothetical protein [Pseudooceanicola atlanticus]